MTEDNLLGTQLDEYRLEALLGHGGMARVYRGLDVRLRRYVAIKVIDTPVHDEPDYRMRFEREAQAIAQLEHPHIVRLYRYGEASGRLYMAMQFIEGSDLGSVLASYRGDGEFIEPDEARRIIREICLALDYAHGRGIIHRDVKPANILLDKEGRPFLTDFGLALLTEIGSRGEVLGTPYYIAPEQAISSAMAVPESDLYSVGIILYEMFTGQVPFIAQDALDVTLLHINEAPPPPSELRPAISPELEAVILKALAKEPEERYPSGAALAQALGQALRGRATILAVPRATIPARVALELRGRQLPPLPASVAPPASHPVDRMPSGGQASASVSPARPVRNQPVSYFVAGMGIGLILLVLCGLAMIGSTFMNSPGGQNRQATDQGAMTEALESVSQASSTAVSSNTPPPFIPPASPTSRRSDTPLPQPTATAIVYDLLVVKGADESSLVLVNRTTAAFPLGPLHFESKESALTGTAWGIEQIESGKCVTAWKSNKNHKLPDGLACEVVGAQLVREGRDRFWKETFEVYYNEQPIITCRKEQTECSITIAP